MKSHTSTQLRKSINENPVESRRDWMIWMMERAARKNGNNQGWQLWQQHNQPLEILHENMFHQKLSYIHYNPVEAGFVGREEDWIYSSANGYGKRGLIDLNYI